MTDIRFYVPKSETIPTDLRLYVGDIYVEYERINNGFRFCVLLDDEEEAMKIAEQIVAQMKQDHDEPQHGISWRTVSLEIEPREERYKVGTNIVWKYRVRDSY